MQWILVGSASGLLVLLSAPGHANADVGFEFREETIAFSDEPLEGSVLIPDVAGEKPGLVLVHGAGRGRRDTLLLEADEFARRGIVTLIYDKRTTGYSQFDRSYRLLADDALAAVRTLAAHPEVDTDMVGLWGVSEGAWVVPLAASHPDAEDDVAFVVLVAATGVPPARQHSWFLEGALRDRGVSGSMIDAVAYRGMRLLVGMGVFAEAYHDPIPPFEAISQPILALWGQHDTVQPAAESMATVREAVLRAPIDRLTMVVFPAAGHALRDRSGPSVSLAEGYPDLVGDWIHEVHRGEPGLPAMIGPQPVQAHPSRAFPPLSWWESAWVVLGGQLVLIAGMLAIAVRFVRHLDSNTLRRWTRFLAAAALAALIGHLVYINLVLVSEAEVMGPVILARPVPWIGLQLLAAAAAIATIGIVLTSRGPSADSRRQRLLVAAGVLFALWAAYWGLLLP